MTDKGMRPTTESAQLSEAEILDNFFEDSAEIEGMDLSVAEIIKALWKAGNISRDELLSALEDARESKD